MKVMIVDDDPVFSDELAELLREAGYEVEAFLDSVFALNGARRVKPAVILLDLQMGNLNGSQAAGYFRKIQETALTPIIGMSGYAGNLDPARIAATFGMDAFLKKPFPPVDLLSRLERLIGVPRRKFARAK